MTTNKTNSTKPASKPANKPSKSSKEVAKPTYQTLKSELDTVMAELQREDLDVDAALAHYKRGLELVQQLERYLGDAGNTISELKAKFT
jgi:exodeoxyribonuclease VII small subunit